MLADIAQPASVLVYGAEPVETAARLPQTRGDQRLWVLLAARADLLLVTDDKALLADRGMQPHVVTPLCFVEAG